LLGPQAAPTPAARSPPGGQTIHTTHRPAGYPDRDVASLHARHGRLARLDSHQLDRSLVGCSLLLRCRALSSPFPCRFIPAHPQFPPSPSERSTPHTPGGSSGPHLQALRPFHRLHPDFHGLGSSFSARGRVLTTRQASLHAADRSVAPPEGLSTLGFDPARFPTGPPACYRASWQLPGRDSHPHSTTSLCWIRSTQSSTSNAGRTKNST
jgi:hypothetical protein